MAKGLGCEVSGGGMATITATGLDAPTRTRKRRQGRVRDVLALGRRKGALMAGAARHHDWSPALTISGLAAVDTAAWTTFGRGAAWLAAGLSILIFDWSRDR